MAEACLAGLPRLLDRFDPALREIEEDDALSLSSGAVLVRHLEQATR